MATGTAGRLSRAYPYEFERNKKMTWAYCASSVINEMRSAQVDEMGSRIGKPPFSSEARAYLDYVVEQLKRPQAY